MISRERIGDVYLFVTVFVWGNTYAASKLALTAMPPMTYAAMRYVLASALLMAILGWRGSLKLPDRRDLLAVFLLGFTGVTAMHVAWTYGLTLTSASKASILVATSPIFSNIFAIFWGQRIRAGAWAGIFLSFAGIFLVINNSFTSITLASGNLLGDVLVLGCSISWALFTVVAPPYVARMGALRLTAWSTLFGTVMLLPFMLLDIGQMRIEALTPPIIGSFLFAGIIAGALGYIWWYEGIARLGVARSVVYTYLIPLVAITSSALLLGEQISGPQIAGGVIALAGIAITRQLSRVEAGAAP